MRALRTSPKCNCQSAAVAVGAKLSHLDCGVRGGHLLLDFVRREIGQAAAGALDAAETGEVVVEAAGFTAALDEGQPFAAVTAQAALEEMVVLAVTLAGLRVGRQDALDPAEGVLVDQRLVLAGVIPPRRSEPCRRNRGMFEASAISEPVRAPARAASGWGGS